MLGHRGDTFESGHRDHGQRKEGDGTHGGRGVQPVGEGFPGGGQQRPAGHRGQIRRDSHGTCECLVRRLTSGTAGNVGRHLDMAAVDGGTDAAEQRDAQRNAQFTAGGLQ